VAIPSSRWFFLLLLGILAIFCTQVAQGYFILCDRAVAEWVATLRSPGWDETVRTITFFGSSGWAWLALGGWGWWAWRRRAWPLALRVIGAFGLGLILEIALRLVVGQWRPDTLLVPAVMDWRTRFALAGFPSGHGYRSAFVFGWLMRRVSPSRWAKAIRWGSLAMIVLVGFSRLYLNRHWATDVIGSWLLACVALSLARRTG